MKDKDWIMAKTHKALQARLDAQREALLKRRRGAVRMYNNWLKFAIGFLAIYSLLPILAPTLMKLGITGPANAIYTIYSPTCHQFAFRSTFLFGESTTYPRDVSVAEGATFEDYAVQSEEFQDIYTRRRPCSAATRPSPRAPVRIRR